MGSGRSAAAGGAARRGREYIFSSAPRLTTCLTWPAPPAGGLEPPVPAGRRASTFPTLILAGQVDNVTSPREGRMVAARFPRFFASR